MTAKIATALALALGMFSHGMAAQDSAASAAAREFQILGIYSLPQGDLGDEEKGAATMGFGGGVEFLTPMKSKPNMQIVAGAYYIFHPTDNAEIEKQMEEFFGEEVTATGGNFTTITVLGGVRVNNIGMPGLYLQGQAGINIASVSDYTVDFETGGDYTDTFESANSFAFSLGAGMKLGKLDIGVRYMNFGEPEFDVESEDEYGYTMEGKAELAMSLLAVTVGYSF